MTLTLAAPMTAGDWAAVALSVIVWILGAPIWYPMMKDVFTDFGKTWMRGYRALADDVRRLRRPSLDQRIARLEREVGMKEED